MTSARLSWCVKVRDLKTRCVGVCGDTTQMYSGVWQCMGRMSCDVEPLSNAWRHVRSLMASRLPQVHKSAQDDLSGTYRKLIEAIFIAVMQKAMVFAV